MAQEIDRFIVVQPIQMCDDNGNNCADAKTMPEETRQTLAQAGIFVVFLDPIQQNNTDLQRVKDVPDISKPVAGETVQAWFVLDILEKKGAEKRTAGMGYNGKNGLIVDATMYSPRVVAHELGHNLGLGHADENGPPNVMKPSTNLSDDRLNAEQIETIRNSRLVQVATNEGCTGDSGANAIGKTLGDVCLSLSGDAGDDTLTLTGGAVLGDLTADDGADTVTIGLGSFVLGNVFGGAGSDRIAIAGQVGGLSGERGRVSGGDGDDVIVLDQGAIVQGAISANNGDDLIVMNDGKVAGGIVGGGGNDTINIFKGVISQRVSGGRGNDVIDVGGPVNMPGGVDGGAGNDALTLAGAVGTYIGAEGRIPEAALGGVGDDIIALNAGLSVLGNVFGDDNDGNEANDGNDVIIMNGGVVGAIVTEEGSSEIYAVVIGNVLGEGGSDIISVQGGDITGGVFGGGGDDAIEIAGEGKVHGLVDGGAGNDTIVVAAELAPLIQPTNQREPQPVLGGAGGDAITLNVGAAVKSSVFGDDNDGDDANGDGDDLIVLNGGTVEGGVHGEGGNDTIIVNGVDLTSSAVANLPGVTNTTVVLAVDGGAGRDTIAIRGGSVNSVLGGAGDDKAIWTGGLINYFVDMGTGSDAFDVVGRVEAATLETAASTSNTGSRQVSLDFSGLNGGDDASSADGQIDTLNLRAIDQRLPEMLNWEVINLRDGSVGDFGRSSRSIVTEQFFVEAGSMLTASATAPGASGGTAISGKTPASRLTFTVDGNLRNEGAVNMTGAARSHDTLAVTGVYTGGPGSLLTMDVSLGEGGSTSDLMRVGVATAGHTDILIGSARAAPDIFNPLGIEIVRVESATSGNTAAEHFSLLGGPVRSGLWTWDLALDATRSDPGRATADVHVLFSRPGDAVQLTPHFGTGALTAFHASLEPWIDRRQALADAVAGNDLAVVGSMKDRVAPPSATFVDLWAAPFGARRTEDSTGKQTFFGNTFSDRLDHSQTTAGFQAGIDLVTKTEDGGAVMGGVFGGFVNATLSPDTAPVSGEYEGGAAGVYLGYLRSGFSFSAAFKADLLQFDWKTPGLETSTGVNTFGGRIETAYRLNLMPGGGGWAEPYASLTYASSSWGRFTAAETVFGIDDNESLLGRMGLRMGTDFRDAASHARIFAGAGIVHEFDGKNTATVENGGFTLPLAHEVDKMGVELHGGFKLEDTATGISLSVTSSGRFSKNAEEYGGRATLNYRF